MAKTEVINKIEELIKDLKNNYKDINKNIQEITTKIEIFFMQNLKDYDIYTLREAIFELSTELEDTEGIEKELIFHIALIFSYLKENLHPVEIYEEGIVYNDIYVSFLSSLAEGSVNLDYPLAVDYINDILSREGFIKKYIDEEEILKNGIFFYKAVEGKILDFCFNKVLFNKIPVIVKSFVIVDGEEVKFKNKFVKDLYREFYEGLEKKFGNIKPNKKFSKILDKNVISLRKYLISLIDKKELEYMISTAVDNTENIFLFSLRDFTEDLLKFKELGALRLALGLGIDNFSFMTIPMRYFPTDYFVIGISALVKGYQTKDKTEISPTFGITLEEFIRKFTLEIPLIANNPDSILDNYKRLIEEFKNFLIYIGDIEENSNEFLTAYTKYLYLYRTFKFEEANKIFNKAFEEAENEEKIYLKIMNLVSLYLTENIKKEKLIKELEKMFEEINSEFSSEDFENEAQKLIYQLTYIGHFKLLKYILSDEEDNTDIYRLLKGFIENDEESIKKVLINYYEEIDRDLIENFGAVLKTVAYNTLKIYPFDKKIYQLYNPTYNYKVPKIKENKEIVWE